MNSNQFQVYLERAVIEYASEKVKAGNWQEDESVIKARRAYEELLPNGEKTENQYLYSIEEDGKQVGVIWLGKKSNTTGFIYDFYILEQYRGQGYGKQAMKLIEEEGKKLGLTKIGLHVFGHNKVAISLYEKLGYEVTNINMIKKI